MADTDIINEDEELGGTGPQQRDWKGIGTALLVIMIICTVIFVAGYILTPLSAASDQATTVFNLTDVAKFRIPYWDLEFINDTNVVFMVPSGIETFNIETKERKKVIDRETMQSTSQTQVVSRDLQYIAMLSKAPNPSLNPDNITIYINIMDINTHQTYKVGVAKDDQDAIQVYKWNPKGNDYVFVQNGQIYYSKDPNAKDLTQVSKSTSEDQVHGFFDWMSDEEIFDDRAALWWSKDGNQLAYGSRDAKPGRTVTIVSYDKDSVYPFTSELPYPKVGEKRLPAYTLSIWDKRSNTRRNMAVQLRDSISFHYLFSVSWVILNGQNYLIASWARRYQNHLSITLCHYDTALCSLIGEHDYKDKQWATPDDIHSMIYSNDSIFLLLPKQKTDGNSYQQIAKMTIQSDPHSDKWALPTFLAAGNYDVKKIVRYDAATDRVFFLAFAPQPGNTNLYSTSASTSSAEDVVCVTCVSSNCTNQGVIVSPDGNNAIISCRGPSYPYTLLASIEQGKKLKNVEEVLHETEYTNLMKSTRFPLVIDENVTVASGFDARVQLILPSDQMAKTHTRSLPVMIRVYNGPNFQMVTDAFQVSFEEYMVAKNHIAVLKIDGRASGARGWKYRSPIYGQLGTVEMLDQITAIKEMLSRYPFLDPHRIAVFGWSYGGFASVNMVEMANEGFFKCAVSVAPVSNFLYYDAAYTERYMGDAGKEAYMASDLSRDVSHFKTTKLLLIHGLTDDNVHFQNSAVFIEQMQIANIDFDLMVYPNENHHIQPKRMHVFGKIENFLTKCFSL